MTGQGTILLAAGGTGGHVFPALALGEALTARGFAVVLVTDRRGAAYPGLEDTIPRATIAAGHLGGGLGARLAGAARLLRGFGQSLALLRRFKPVAVVGFGGYPSLPMMLAAGWSGAATVVHEQNALLGTANRLAARRARAVALSVAETVGIGGAADRTQVIGNPVRPEIAALAQGGYDAPDDGAFRLLVTGGSQGARVFGEAVPAALGLLTPAQRARLQVTQQCVAADADKVRESYRDLGVEAEVTPFIADMAGALRAAHLVICRAGASTVAELTAAGRPAILVPLPNAAADHQTANARALANAGAGWLVAQGDTTAAALATHLGTYMETPADLAAAAKNAGALARPDAATRLADLVAAVAGGARHGETPEAADQAGSDSSDHRLCEAVR